MRQPTDILRIAALVQELGPRLMLVDETGTTVAYRMAREQYDACPDVVLIRADGATLGAPLDLSTIARTMWRDMVVAFMVHGSAAIHDMAEWAARGDLLDAANGAERSRVPEEAPDINEFLDEAGTVLWSDTIKLKGLCKPGTNLVHEYVSYMVVACRVDGGTQRVTLRLATDQENRNMRYWGSPEDPPRWITDRFPYDVDKERSV